MHGDIMNLHQNTLLVKEIVELFSASGAHDHQVITVTVFTGRPGLGTDLMEVSEVSIILPDKFKPALPPLGKPLDLGQPDGGLQIGHAGVDAQVVHFVVPTTIVLFQYVFIFGDSVTAQEAKTPGKLVVACGDGAAFACGHAFYRMKAEAGHGGAGAGANGMPLAAAVLPLSADGVAGIFNDDGLVLLGKIRQVFHGADKAREVDRQDYFDGRVGGESFFHQIGVDVQGFGIDVHENRFGSAHDSGIGGGGKGIWRGNESVARAETGRAAGQQQRIGAVGYGKSMGRLAEILQGLLKLPQTRALGQPVTVENLTHEVVFFGADALFSIRQTRGHHSSFQILGTNRILALGWQERKRRKTKEGLLASRETKQDTAVVIVQARMGSLRLPGKMMENLAGQPLLWHILQRAARVRHGLPVVLATTDHPRDRVLAEVAADCGAHLVCGSEENVLSRFLLALEKHPARWVVRVCGDSPLFDPSFLNRCLKCAQENDADVVKFKNDPPSLFQGGEVVSAKALNLSLERAADDPLAYEHVTAWAMRNAERIPEELKTAYIQPVEGMMTPVKLSIDTPEDLQKLRLLYQELYEGSNILDLETAARWIRDGGWN
jgi:spore coat polysaccharide biosynthesis protein SpsF (cytidylyltransferase family)